jgi:Zn-dependent oligopeptidase
VPPLPAAAAEPLSAHPPVSILPVTETLTPLSLPAPADAEEWLDARARDDLERARELVAGIKADKPTDAVDLLNRWNDVSIAIGNVASVSSLFSEVHPLEAVRSRGEAAMQEVQKLDTELSLDRDLYEVFAAVDGPATAALDPVAKRLFDKTLLDFHRGGVDKDDATRARVKELSERAILVGQEFSKNIRDDVRSVRVTPDKLAGMPQDWVDAHPVEEDGLVTLTTDYPDVVPFSTYGRDRDTRRALRMEFLNRAWPANDALLTELFELRREHAQLLGYPDWAEYDAEVKMIKHGSAIPEFIDRIADAALASGERDRQVVLDRMRQDFPDAETIDASDLAYYAEAVRREQLDVDAQQVRTYFDFTAVRRGLLEVTGRLFGLTYRPAEDAVLWDEAVVAYDVFLIDTDQHLGRIYLDLHPREGKFKHAAQFDLVRGIGGRQLAEGVLVCNFPRGLMEHSDVTTLFHEFGHLVHHVLAGRGPWVRFSGVATEWDFVEAPSQMLEEWAWDADVLRTFAHDAAGEAIPEALVARMRRADDFGKGYNARTQMFYASMSYWFHVDIPEDLTARTKELQNRYSLFPYIEGTHMPASFGHLEGYGSGYYTYMWSLVIAKDMFSAFDRDNMFDPEVAGRYRDRLLAQGGQRDAADLVADFLGRPYTFDAYAAWLAE